ncbi:hypothetical protein ACWA06_05945 [Serratia rhizosphaerae]|nr:MULTISPECIES: hypothetical protein [unclassified Serratia (in: enterobacteria)]CAE1148438.1 protein of unknown function [Serratia sp. Tan611]
MHQALHELPFLAQKRREMRPWTCDLNQNYQRFIAGRRGRIVGEL